MATFNRVNIICFGQQPCGFFPKRFLVAKINTARRLQKEIGGRIVFFYHDSDADYRETITIMRDRISGDEVRLNFLQPNKIQKKFSPLYAKRIAKGWKESIIKQLPRFITPSLALPPQGGGNRLVSPPLMGGRGFPKNRKAILGVPRGVREGELIDIFKSIDEKLTAADFCLEMYQKLGLLKDIEVVRSSETEFREKAIDITDGFIDVEYQNEIVRAHFSPLQEMERDQGRGRNQNDSNLSRPDFRRGTLPIHWGGEKMIGLLHEGGGRYTTIPLPDKIEKRQISAGSKERFKWMQSVIKCTHYVYGEGEKNYLKFDDFPDVKFIQRDEIEQPEYAWLPN